ncbi:MAG: lytic murein transglycosylase B [Burkholderiales bacterium]|nr:lytic murein transglycosylase B [Burkholderiales bacterium]
MPRILRMMMLRAVVCVLVLAAAATHAAAHSELAADAQAFVRDMVERHGFERSALERALRNTKFLASIVRAMDAPSTALPWHEFRARHITEARINAGLRFWTENAVVLERAAVEYQVPPEIMVATIGIETLFGRLTGNVNVLDALTTLAFGYPRRADFFRAELEQFLLLSRENGWDLNSVKGSFAGAIGVPQFLPSSYRKYAVDFDGDGRRDLRQVTDAIGSVANYYRQFGWQQGAPVIVPVDVGNTALEPLLGAGLLPHISVAELRKRGVLPLEPVADDVLASLFSVETEVGPRYWLGLNNFYVITRYNRSINYAMVVQELASTLRQQRPRTAGVAPAVP